MKPENTAVRIKSFKTVKEDIIVKSIKMLGSDKNMHFERNKKYMQIDIDSALYSDLPVCFKIELG